MLESSMNIPDDSIPDRKDHPSSIIEASSSIPAFVGYTEKVACGEKSFLYTPIRVSSIAEYRSIFGGAPRPIYTLTDAQEGEQTDLECCGKTIVARQQSVSFMMYYQIQMFYANGGDVCYVVSVGNYSVRQMDPDAFKKGIQALKDERAVTILVCPEAIALKNKEMCYQVQAAMIYHCGFEMHNRVAILDVYKGNQSRSNPKGDPVDEFRNYIGYSWLDYAAAYYPWVNASVVREEDLSWVNIDLNALIALLELEKTNLCEGKRGVMEKCLSLLKVGLCEKDSGYKRGSESENKTERESLNDSEREEVHQKLLYASNIYPMIIKKMVSKLNVLPPSAAMAGIYTQTDHEKGVWKAPANVALKAVDSAVVELSHDEQEDLNLPLTGKSLNAIRSFFGQGVLVWGARTLNGNSLDWKYIHVRRTIIMIEESVKQTVALFTDYDNTAYLWVTMKAMITEFLNKLWKNGGLAGAVPEDAFSVHVGLGETMTGEDILNGRLRVVLYVALSNPGEFVEIMIEQNMWKNGAER